MLCLFWLSCAGVWLLWLVMNTLSLLCSNTFITFYVFFCFYIGLYIYKCIHMTVCVYEFPYIMYKWYECGFDVASRFLLLHICFCSAFVASLLYWNSFLPHATVAATTNQPATFPYNNKPWQHTIKKAKTMLIPSATNTTKTANNWSLVSATRNSGKFYFTCVVLWLFIQLLFSHVCPYLHASTFLVANFVVVVWFTFSICLYPPYAPLTVIRRHTTDLLQ